MKEYNAFEEFMKGKKEAFSDQEPAFGHFNRFDDKLKTLHEEHQPVKTHNTTFIYAVACACLVLISMVVYPFLEIKPSATPKHTKVIDQVDRKIYNEMRESLSNPAMQASYNADENFETILQEITNLEMEYVQLKQNYNSSNHCDEVLGEMKRNLQNRLTILEKIHNREDSLDIIRFVHQEYMLNQASDCFGYPARQTKGKQSHNMVALAY